MLLVKKHSFELEAPRGMSLEPRDWVIESAKASMRFDKVGWGGTPIDRRDCIHVTARDEKGRRIEFALSPEGGAQPAWDALAKSGVRTNEP
jgi:hypothetical protein